MSLMSSAARGSVPTVVLPPPSTQWHIRGIPGPVMGGSGGWPQQTLPLRRPLLPRCAAVDQDTVAPVPSGDSRRRVHTHLYNGFVSSQDPQAVVEQAPTINVASALLGAAANGVNGDSRSYFEPPVPHATDTLSPGGNGVAFASGAADFFDREEEDDSDEHDGEPLATYKRIGRAIRGCKTLVELREILERDGHTFNAISTSQAASTLARLHQSLLGSLASAQLLTPAALSHHQQAHLSPCRQLLDELVRQHAPYMDAWGVAGTLWAYSALDYYDRGLFELLCSRALAVADDMRPTDVANVMTAFGRWGHYHPELLHRLPQILMDHIYEAKPCEVSQTFWCLGRLRARGVPGRATLLSMCEMISDSMHAYGGQELSTILWALVRLQLYPGLSFLQRAEGALLQRLRAHNADNNSRPRRTNQRTQQQQQPGSQQYSHVLQGEQRTGAPNGVGNVNGSTPLPPPSSSRHQPPSFPPPPSPQRHQQQQPFVLHPVAPAVAHAQGHRYTHDAATHNSYAPQQQPEWEGTQHSGSGQAAKTPGSQSLLRASGVLRPQDMAMSLWALGKLRYKAAWLLDEVPLSLGAWLHAFTARDMCCVLHGYAAARHYHRGVLEAAAALLHPRLPTMSLDELVTILQAYSVFQHRPTSQPAFLPALADALHASLRRHHHRRHHHQHNGSVNGVNSQYHHSNSNSSSYDARDGLTSGANGSSSGSSSSSARPQTYALIAKSCANLQIRPEALLVEVVGAASSRLSDFKPEEMAHLLYGLSHLVSRPPHCELPPLATAAAASAPVAVPAAAPAAVPVTNGSGNPVPSSSSSRVQGLAGGVGSVTAAAAMVTPPVMQQPPAPQLQQQQLPSLRPDEMQVFYHVVRQIIWLLDEPSHPYAAPTHLHHQVLNSILFSCLRVGYTPWSLVDFAESKGFRLKQPKQARPAAAGANGDAGACEVPARAHVTLPGNARRGHHAPPPADFDAVPQRRRRPGLRLRAQRPTLFGLEDAVGAGPAGGTV